MDTTGTDDIYISEILTHEGLAEYKITIPPAVVQPTPTELVTLDINFFNLLLEYSHNHEQGPDFDDLRIL